MIRVRNNKSMFTQKSTYLINFLKSVFILKISNKFKYDYFSKCSLKYKLMLLYCFQNYKSMIFWNDQ